MDSNSIINSNRIDVVSLGVGDLATLAVDARVAISSADVLIGADHHFQEVYQLASTARCIKYPSPFNKLDELLKLYAGHKITVLASGDALFFGVGRSLCNLIDRSLLRFHANVSSVQACFHAIGMPWQNARVVSLHGRPTSSIRRELRPGIALAVLTDTISTPQVVAAELIHADMSESTVWVCESMGSDEQVVNTYTARELVNSNRRFHALNVCIAQLNSNGQHLPTFPGIADHLFLTGSRPGFGMISKREVRLSILSCMQPVPGEIAWDIGAGCGSVSVEWSRWNPLGKIYAIESNEERISYLNQNREKFGVEDNCMVVHGVAPAVCGGLPKPNCIFIGGSSGALNELLELSWSVLEVGGKLVVSAVTTESQQVIDDWRPKAQETQVTAEWIELSIRKTIASDRSIRELAPVQILSLVKPGNMTTQLVV